MIRYPKSPIHPISWSAAAYAYAAASKPAPPPLREVPATTGLFAELLWQAPHDLRRRNSAEGRENLTAWKSLQLSQADFDLAKPDDLRRVEETRLRSITAHLACDGDTHWAAGGRIIVSGSGVGWPVGWRSRSLYLGRESRAEVSWLADVAGLRCLFIGEEAAESVLLGLPRVEIPEFREFASTCKLAGVDPKRIAGLV